MRSIGTLPTENAAMIFCSHLFVQGIETELEREDNGEIAIWVKDDDQVKKAAENLEVFRANPDAPEFKKSVAEAQQRKAVEAANESRRATVADEARVQYERTISPFPWLPILFAVICVFVAIWSNTLSFAGKFDLAVISKFTIRAAVEGTGLPEIKSGHVWRLITPIFVHFGILHLVFNLFWLRDLGGFVQARFGAGYLLVLILVIAVLSNLGEYAWSKHALFGGMSGVNYGLFGFLWMRGKHDRFAGWQLNPMVVQTMMLWFFLCFFVIPNVANAAHLVGLIIGMAWGYASARWSEIQRMR